ncbi:transmembrane protein 128-like [Liolophura sinensis]|uniref:transmembrane protein 128-like n=1 Tax=Liolophura sinensis TaxID=3198878 RepID=UPI00315813C5
MAASDGGDYQNELHRRVQHKIAGHYLKAMQPDEAPEDKLKMDSETRRRFEDKYGKYKRNLTSSPYTIQNVCWLIVSMAVFYYTDFYLVLRYDPKVNRFWLNIGLLLIGVNVSIALFLILWLNYVKKLTTDQWEKRYPAAIPIATACFILGGILLTVGLWPVWRILTPVILAVLFMGFVVTVAMFPNF